jgi:membrane fusion protein (multidrug efflux system)
MPFARRTTPLIALLATLAVGKLACGPDGVDAGHAAEAPPITVELLKVEPQLLRDTATFSGQLDAEYSVELKAETSGVIEAVLFEEGQAVEKGAELFRLRDDEQVARLNEAIANRDLAQEVWDRTQQLVSRDAASAAQKDRAAAELSVAKARVDLARLALDRTRIKAPFDGVVGARFVAPGDRITDKKALVRIDAIDRLQLSFAISEQGIAFARNGVKLELRVRPCRRGLPARFVSPSLDPTTRRMILRPGCPAPTTAGPEPLRNVDSEIAQRETRC